MNMRYVLGTATIVLIVGGTIYAIKKSKDAEKVEESAISVEEARAIVNLRRMKLDVREDINSFKELSEEEIEEIVDDAREMAAYNTEFLRDPSEEDLDEPEDEDENYEFYDGLDAEVPLAKTMKEEDKELRYHPDSIDARNQFMKMELAEWVPLEDIYQTMLRLFEFPFEPTNDGDADLFTKLVDYRAQFFGFNSKWIRKITYADVILHFARLAVFNQGEGMRYWVDYFLEFNELDHTIPSHDIDEKLRALNNHIYFNEERVTFGLFGLTRESMDQAIRIANRNIDRSVTYEIEFNEFLKSCL